MQPTIKTYVRPENWNSFIDKTPQEVKDEAEAVQVALARHAVCFRTYEISSVTFNGKELKGEPENFSPRRYVGVDKLYTRDEVAASYEADIPQAFDRMMAGILKRMARETRKMPPDAVYIAVERPGEFTELHADEKVFDRDGRQLWPKQAAPQSRPSSPSP
jgi:hypothetical protein